MMDSDGDGKDNGDEKIEGKTSDEDAEICMVLSKPPQEVRETLESYARLEWKGQAFEKLTEVHDGLSLIMNAVKMGSVPTVKAVFEAMESVLDDDQLTRAFAGGIPGKNRPLLFLAAQGNNKDIFDAVLGVLHSVVKVSHKSGKKLQDPNEHSGGRGVLPVLHGEVQGELTLLQSIYSGKRPAVKTWIQRSEESTRQELSTPYAGRMAVMHAALVGPCGMVPDLLGVMRQVYGPSDVRQRRYTLQYKTPAMPIPFSLGNEKNLRQKSEATLENREANYSQNMFEAALKSRKAEDSQKKFGVALENPETEESRRKFEATLEKRESNVSLLLSAAEGGNHLVFREIMEHELWERNAPPRVKLLDLFLKGYTYGRAALLDAALNEGLMSFRAVAEFLDKELSTIEATEKLQDSLFDGRDDCLRANGVPARLAVAAWVAKLSQVLKIHKDNKMANMATDCLEAELHGIDKSLLPRDNREDHWSGRLSFLLACGATVSPGTNGYLDKMFNSLGFDNLKKCIKQAISVVDNPFIPGMMLAFSLAMEAPNAKENKRCKMKELRWMVEDLLLEVFERLPQTVQGFPDGARDCSVLFEPETIGARSESFKGPLQIAFTTDHLITTFCTQPLIVDFISHTFFTEFPNVPANMQSGKLASWVDPFADTPLEKGLQFIFMGHVVIPFTFHRVPFIRMLVDYFLLLLVNLTYLIVVTNIYDTTSLNGWEIALGFYVVVTLITEASAVGRHERENLRYPWNALDVVILFLLLAGFVIRLWNALGSGLTGHAGEVLNLLAGPLLIPRILFVLQTQPKFGEMIQAIIRMVGEVFRFSLILLFVMTGFALPFWARRKRFVHWDENETKTIEVIYTALFKAMLGDFADIEDLILDPDWVDKVVFVFYVVVTTIMLLNLLIAILTTAHGHIVERGEKEIKAAMVRIMEYYRKVVANDVLPAPLNLFQLLALFLVWMINVCRDRKLYDKLKPTIPKLVGNCFLRATVGPFEIILNSLWWYVLTPRAVINKWDKKKQFWGNLLRSVAVVLGRLVVVPSVLTYLWALEVGASVRQIMNLSEELPLSDAPSNAPCVTSTVGQILMRTGDGLGVHQLFLYLDDPLSDPLVQQDEETRPTTVKHIKLLRNRLEEIFTARVDNLKAKEERLLEDIQIKLDAVLKKREISRA